MNRLRIFHPLCNSHPSSQVIVNSLRGTHGTKRDFLGLPIPGKGPFTFLALPPWYLRTKEKAPSSVGNSSFNIPGATATEGQELLERGTAAAGETAIRFGGG